MRKLDFLPTAKGAATPIMSKQDKKDLVADRQRRDRLKRQLRLLYDDVAREDVPDALMALVDQIGQASAEPAPAEAPDQAIVTDSEENSGPAPA
jgi:hypothetical protein